MFHYTYFFNNLGLALPAETITEFEDEFHELWSDPKDEAAAAKELADEEASIEQDNLDYENGKSSYSEKLNELSALPEDEFAAEKLGLLDGNSRVYPTGLIETPEAERTLSPEDQAYLDKIYEDLDREYIPSSYDARSQGTFFFSCDKVNEFILNEITVRVKVKLNYKANTNNQE